MIIRIWETQVILLIVSQGRVFIVIKDKHVAQLMKWGNTNRKKDERTTALRAR